MAVGADPLVLVVVPTHDHSDTLDLAVGSALAQTHRLLEVVIVGDGVDPPTRTTALRVAALDPRVRFLDMPKGERHGELHRDAVIRQSAASIVTYLGDDDLLHPDHVTSTVHHLRDAEFVHPLPILIDGTDGLVCLPTDLSDPACIAWHLRPGCNTIGLTGAAHTRELYERLPNGWHPAPAGTWTDHHFWQQVLRAPGLRAVTAARCTVCKVAAGWAAPEESGRRRERLEQWWSTIRRADFPVRWDAATGRALRSAAVQTYRELVDVRLDAGGAVTPPAGVAHDLHLPHG